MKMIFGRIAMMLSDVRVLGYGRALCVWTQGCSRNCNGCETPEFQKQLPSVDLSEFFVSFIEKVKSKPDSLVVSGGEPFVEQNRAAVRFLVRQYRQLCNELHIRPLLFIYTGYTYGELKGMHDNVVEDILGATDILIDGPYIANKNTHVGAVGSSNQHVLALTSSVKKITKEYSKLPRRNQLVWSESLGKFISVGVKI